MINFEYTPPEKKKEPELRVKAYRHRAIPFISSAIEIIALLGLSGLLTIVQFNGKINEIVFDVFILYMTLRLIMLFLSKDISSRLRVEQGQKELEHKKIVENFLDTAKSVDCSRLDEYIKNVENPRRKAEAWKNKIIPKIDRTVKSLEKLKIKLLIAQKKEKKAKRLKEKIERLENKTAVLKEKISDAYLDKNLTLIRVKYTKVNVNQFFVSDLSGEVSDDKLKINVDFENKVGILKSMPFSIILIVFTTLIGLDSITIGSLNVITLFLDLISIAFYMAMGWFSIGAKTLAKQRKVIVNKIAFVEQYKKEKAVK